MLDFLKKKKKEDEFPDLPPIDSNQPLPNTNFNSAPNKLNHQQFNQMGSAAPNNNAPMNNPNRNPNVNQPPGFSNKRPPKMGSMTPTHPQNNQMPNPLAQQNKPPAQVSQKNVPPPMPPSVQNNPPQKRKKENPDLPSSVKPRKTTKKEPVEDIPSLDLEVPEPPSPSSDHVSLMTEDVEKIVNEAIDEKWEKLDSELDKVKKWKKDFQKQTKELKDSNRKTEKKLEETQKAVMSKVNDYNDSIKDVNTELKAMGKVFKKIMPVFTDNVKKLSRIAKKK